MVADTLGADVIVNESGRFWSYPSIGGHMWRIVYSDSFPNHCLAATNLGGTPQNAKVNYGYNVSPGTTASWWFIPLGDLQRLVRNQGFIPKDLFSISSQTLQKIVADMLVVFRDDLKEVMERALIWCMKRTVSYFELEGRRATRQDRTFDLRSSQLGGPATELFAYIAQRVKEAVVEKWHLSSTKEKPLLMGLTFAFPVTKKSLHSAKLLRWTKEITTSVSSASGTVGKDVVELLQVALKNIEGLHIECNALINDAGAIFDSGTNGAYVEAAENVESLKFNNIGGHMVLNTEWGSFGNITNLQRTQFDHQIDRESAHPGKQIFEKLISSTSVGELVRLVLLHYIDTTIPPLLTRNRPLFNRISSQKLNTKGGIDVTLVWDIDDADDDNDVKELLVKRLGLSPNNVTEEDAKTVKEICRAILLRTARLGACAIASILVLMGRAQVGGGIEKRGRVGINGSLTNIPAFQRDMKEALGEIIGANATKNVLISHVNEDRIDLGAAVCACLASSSE
ncbi:hypothetical protein GALMADRAFT_215200 [Galerina marginata CBS 339.88]|uniref:Phosphotransferase n=1 Tax=Galerina marginata (strain CBS 339.88) TaxID=685588 RepID=A0A067SDZ1_GALM3|nr:hypothetical protein GALMADRAFT_215200 [Galerina marginata CBS 339.88]